MMQDQDIFFPPFRLDPANEQLWRGSRVVPLRRKSFTVLHYLAVHAGRLVTKEELLSTIWPNTYVSGTVPTGCIRELRRALGDRAETPRFIETVHRRGYRFVAPVTNSELIPPFPPRVLHQNSGPVFPVSSAFHSSLTLVGREGELARLQSSLETALQGKRQVIFVTGEDGIGKTTVVDAFLAQACAGGNCWITRGQCIEHYGPGEAYLPVLDAFGRLSREPGGKRFVELLGQYAPTWLVQMPTFVSAAELDALQQRVRSATRERMLRELAEALEVLTAERPLILALEDLQGSDYSTLDLLVFLAQRREPAQLLVVGTYRPAEVLGNEHPLKVIKQELEMHGYCEELPLGFLTEADVAEYLATRFGGGAVREPPLRILARVIHQRTDGNPLFMVNVVDYLVAQGVISPDNGHWQLKNGIDEVDLRVPEGLRQMIQKQIDRVSPEGQRVLEVGSVAGAEFSAAAVAAGVGADVVQIEEWCEGLIRRGQFLRSRGREDWLDGTVAARYGFIHAVYQDVLYERVSAGRRVQLHRKIGERQEAGYGSRAGEIASELAVHFEQGRDYHKAVRYRQQAAENALRRSAYREAIDHLHKGLSLLNALPNAPERVQQEMAVQTDLGWVLQLICGAAAPEAERAYTRVLELGHQAGEDSPLLLRALQGLREVYYERGESQAAHQLAEQCLPLAQRRQDPEALFWAHHALGETSLLLGELLLARKHLEHGLAIADAQPHSAMCVPSLSWLTYVLWLLGYPDQALKRSQAALDLARRQAHPHILASALYFAAGFHVRRREWRAAQELAQAVVTLSVEQGFTLWLAQATVLHGRALAAQGQREEGITQMRQGLAAYQAAGARVARPYQLALLAEAYGEVGRVEAGLTVLAEALEAAHDTGQCLHEARLFRLKGKLLLEVVGAGLKPAPTEEAEVCFQKAIEIARRQGAKSLELQAVMSLSRLWQQRGHKAEAREMLAEAYNWFTEGFDTADLQEARGLLEELA